MIVFPLAGKGVNMNPYFIFFIFILASLGFVAAVLVMNALLGPRSQATKIKLSPFECGAQPLQQRNVRPLSIKYYPVAIFFLLFDLETVFLFIWASAFGNVGSTELLFASFLFFMGMMTFVFIYIWREGGLEWR